jgi:hypothetical protein
MERSKSMMKHPANLRSFMKSELLAGGAAILGAALLSGGKLAFGQNSGGSLTKGDAAILRFLAAAELLESDLWTEYAALAGLIPSQLLPEVIQSPPRNSYQAAFLNFDGGAAQYISSNTLDEESHAVFLNAYLESEDSLTDTRRHLYETSCSVTRCTKQSDSTGLQAMEPPAIGARSDTAAAHFDFAQALNRREDFEGAIGELLRSLTLQPAMQAARRDLAAAYTNLGQN